MAKQKKSKEKLFGQIIFRKYLFTVSAIGLVMVLALVAYSFYYLNRVSPGVYFANKSMIGMTKQDAYMFVDRNIDDYSSNPVRFVVGEHEVNLKLTDAGIEFDKWQTVEKIMSYGNSGNFIENLATKLVLPFTHVDVGPVYLVDYGLFDRAITFEFNKYEKEVRDATINIESSQPVIVPEVSGEIIDESLLIANLKQNINGLSANSVKVGLVASEPHIKTIQAQKALEKVKSLNNRNISLVFGYDKWTLAGDNLFRLLQFAPKGYTSGNFMSLNLGSDVDIKTININSSSPPDLEVSLNQSELNTFITNIAQSVNKPTVNATLKFEGGKITQFLPAQDGQELDVIEAKELLLSKVSIENMEANQNINIELPVSVTKAQIDNPEVNSLGIKELVGRGVSYFAGSIPNRIFNVGLGASLISGTLVGPGEIFSFDKLVGPVSAAQGFKQAYVISSGRTVLDDGGGICQVSTTVFRAALNAGFPILERTAHAYRVGYYEQHGFGPGLDATIWSPSVDLKFKNDTDHHILVQAIVDNVNLRLEVDIYGTSDGRKVEVSSPVVTSQTPPPPPLYQDDPTLPKGTVKQVDFAAWGAKSSFTQKVYKNGQLIIDKTFYSNFKPWQAVYLVGTS
ncbi:MAG: VanW family protein [Candidatus Curtissbacteria bacterium GW2011_GWA1_40_16]|uniref:VanW family protein n=1 Tax=Candidatus Curtissbacteria bacterium GW2011_GWA1_40_16 TaxID=1618405 RepID=A0A0G0UL27_9BACT|nr:MAG: VanW family protein [Candidatus Curtissbacteria bacterium GW2011_GWA1_40_16]